MRSGTALVLVALMVCILLAGIAQFVFHLG
jgi:hypothetical protein